MFEPGTLVFETERLKIRVAREDDAEHYLALWNDSRVMTMVSFPAGLGITREKVLELIRRARPDEFDRLLVVERASDGAPLGECKLGRPNEEGLAETDVKLRPEHWGHRYGQEVKRGLVDYLFTHTKAERVQGTPNKRNLASIKMQESVGAERVGEGCFVAPEDSALPRCDVPHFVYHVDRATWERRRRR